MNDKRKDAERRRKQTGKGFLTAEDVKSHTYDIASLLVDSYEFMAMRQRFKATFADA